jgi:hypothetical protein
MEAADSSPPAEVARVAVRLQPFWVERPAAWIAWGAVFLVGISSKKTICHMISQLD